MPFEAAQSATPTAQPVLHPMIQGALAPYLGAIDQTLGVARENLYRCVGLATAAAHARGTEQRYDVGQDVGADHAIEVIVNGDEIRSLLGKCFDEMGREALAAMLTYQCGGGFKLDSDRIKMAGIARALGIPFQTEFAPLRRAGTGVLRPQAFCLAMASRCGSVAFKQAMLHIGMFHLYEDACSKYGSHTFAWPHDLYVHSDGDVRAPFPEVERFNREALEAEIEENSEFDCEDLERSKGLLPEPWALHGADEVARQIALGFDARRFSAWIDRHADGKERATGFAKQHLGLSESTIYAYKAGKQEIPASVVQSCQYADTRLLSKLTTALALAKRDLDREIIRFACTTRDKEGWHFGFGCQKPFDRLAHDITEGPNVVVCRFDLGKNGLWWIRGERNEHAVFDVLPETMLHLYPQDRAAGCFHFGPVSTLVRYEGDEWEVFRKECTAKDPALEYRALVGRRHYEKVFPQWRDAIIEAFTTWIIARIDEHYLAGGMGDLSILDALLNERYVRSLFPQSGYRDPDIWDDDEPI